MRRIFAIVLVALLLGVGVVALIETDPGYVLVAYGNYTLEIQPVGGLFCCCCLRCWCMHWSCADLPPDRRPALPGELVGSASRPSRIAPDQSRPGQFLEGNWAAPGDRCCVVRKVTRHRW